MMSWEDLKMLLGKGHYVGSHTVSHGSLEKMNEEEILHELIASGNIIKEKLGYFPMTIAYPLGNYTPRIMELSRKSGYCIGLATKQDIYLPDRDDLFEIPRIELRNEAWWKTLMRITNLLEDVKRKIHYRTHLLIGFGLIELSLD
jgi:peptidoglycan/xylan/chitin deacetylase (PgdA/CDA1 family)